MFSLHEFLSVHSVFLFFIRSTYSLFGFYLQSPFHPPTSSPSLLEITVAHSLNDFGFIFEASSFVHKYYLRCLTNVLRQYFSLFAIWIFVSKGVEAYSSCMWKYLVRKETASEQRVEMSPSKIEENERKRAVNFISFHLISYDLFKGSVCLVAWSMCCVRTVIIFNARFWEITRDSQMNYYFCQINVVHSSYSIDKILHVGM